MDYNEIMGKAERLQLVLSTLDPDLFDKLYALYLEVRGNEGVDADTRGVALVHRGLSLFESRISRSLDVGVCQLFDNPPKYRCHDAGPYHNVPNVPMRKYG